MIAKSNQNQKSIHQSADSWKRLNQAQSSEGSRLSPELCKNLPTAGQQQPRGIREIAHQQNFQNILKTPKTLCC